jgi:hypothetical protein
MMQLQRSNENTAGKPEGTSASGKFWMQPSLLMQKNRVLSLRNDLGYTTIDDVIQLAQELLARLNQLGEYKHPLDVRRGRKEVMIMVEREENSRTIKAGAKTYFLDIKETKEGKPYLMITESRFKGEGEERERSTIIVFKDNAQTFSEALTEMVDKLE